MQKRGFTLVEMVVVVALLAALAAFTLPTFQLILSQSQLTSATSQATDLLRLAEQKTVTEQKLYGVTLTQGASTIPLFLYDPVAGTKTVQSTLTLPANTVVSQVNFSGTTDIYFVTSGAPNVSGNLVLQDTIRTRNREIDVRPSGAIEDNTGEF